MNDSKIQRIQKHAKEKGHQIDLELTHRLRDSLSDVNINIRVPTELKEELINTAIKKNIPKSKG